ncbi:SRPBCC family protein [Halalkalibacterium ligniniphilum]|uniref:SRPBCC family protein n=1 Tax=Halalkalibacterium ligniniphilum TaxID=1134413 RepID=UPI000349F4D6|nr:SRPBCC family protein [Halalkalibacterium ligniniphilum]
MGVIYQIDIGAPIENIFRYVNDDEVQIKWMDGFVENEYLYRPLGTSRVGTTFIYHVKVGKNVREYSGEVIAYNDPSFLGIRYNNQIVTLEVFYRLIENGYGGTTLHCECIQSFQKWYMLLLSPLLNGAMKGLVRKQMRTLKAFAEEEVDNLVWQPTVQAGPKINKFI